MWYLLLSLPALAELCAHDQYTWCTCLGSSSLTRTTQCHWSGHSCSVASLLLLYTSSAQPTLSIGLMSALLAVSSTSLHSVPPYVPLQADLYALGHYPAWCPSGNFSLVKGIKNSYVHIDWCIHDLIENAYLCCPMHGNPGPHMDLNCVLCHRLLVRLLPILTPIDLACLTSCIVLSSVQITSLKESFSAIQCLANSTRLILSVFALLKMEHL